MSTILSHSPFTSLRFVGTCLIGLGLFIPSVSCNKTRKDTNKPPVITDLTANPAGLTIPPATEITLTLVYTDVDETAPDPQTYSYAWTVEALPGTATPPDLATSLLINDANPALWKAPTEAGVYRVTGEVCDRFHDCSERAVTFQVEAPNHAPRITAASADTLSPAINQAVTITITAVDDDQDPLTWVWSATAGQFQSKGDGSAVWVGSAAGTATVSVIVSDPSGASATQQFVMTVS